MRRRIVTAALIVGGCWPQIITQAGSRPTVSATGLVAAVKIDGAERPPIVRHVAGIGVGALSTDEDVVQRFGEGLYVEAEGHGGGRYFTNATRSLTLHTVIGVDRMTEFIELREGLHLPGVSADALPQSAISKVLDDVPQADHGIRLGIPPAKLRAILGPPMTDDVVQGRRVVSYESAYENDDRESLYYLAHFEFVDNRLVRIALDDGE